MGTELLVASLWVAVLVYWLWTRRPTTGDTVGLFRYELRALRQATPTRVPPANRMVPARPAPVIGNPAGGYGLGTSGLPLGEHLAATAAKHRKMLMRRRRRDVLCGLGGAAGILLVLAVLTGSVVFAGLQVFADLSLAGYVWMLARKAGARAARPGLARGPRQPRAAAERRPEVTRTIAADWPEVGSDGAVYDFEVPGAHLFDQVAYADHVSRERYGHMPTSRVPAAAVGSAGGRGRGGGHSGPGTGVATVGDLPDGDDDLAYGDFDSYASLALAQAN